MATPEQISSLRLLVAEPDDAEPYTDAALSVRLDLDGNINKTAFAIWTEKAAAWAGLADITEGGSSRKQGDLHEQALNMAKQFSALLTEGAPTVGGSTRIKSLRRP
jgi:hypothetical protein